MHRELSLPHRPEMFFKIKNSMAENLLVIEKNPLKTSVDELREIKIEQTIHRGKWLLLD